MTDRLRYSGSSLLGEAVGLEEGFDASAPEVLFRRAGLLSEAFGKGVPLGEGLASLGLFIEQLEAYLATASEEPSNAEVRTWSEKVFGLVSSEPLRTYVPMLPASQQWSAYTVLDLLYMRRREDLDDPAAMDAALEFVSKLPTGAPHTLGRCALGRHSEQVTEKTAGLVEALDRAIPLAQEEETLAGLKRAEFEFGVQRERAMASPAPADERLIKKLELLNSELTLHFGGDVFCADPSGGDEAWHAQIRTERAELMQRLDAMLVEEYTEAWTHGFVAFVKGRILLGTGLLEAGRDAFEEALELGFAPWLSGLHLAFANSRLKQRDKARAGIEAVAQRCLVEKGTLSQRYETMARLYFQMGGNPDQVGATEWVTLSPLVEANRQRREDLLSILQEKAIAAQGAFLQQCQMRAETLLGSTVTAADVESALRREDSGDRFLQIDRDKASDAHLDELPGLHVDPGLLVRAVERGVGSHDLVTALLGHIHSLEQAGVPLAEILQRVACVAESASFARRSLEEALWDGVQAAEEVFRSWGTAGRLSEQDLVALYSFVQEQFSARGAEKELKELGEWLAQRLSGDQRSKVVGGVLPKLFAELKKRKSLDDMLVVVDRILEAGGNEESTHEQLFTWAAPQVLDSLGHPLPTRQPVALMEALSARLRYQAGKRMRGLLLDVQFDRLETLEWSRDLVRLVEAILPSCVGSADLEERLVEWYVTTAGRIARSEQVLPILDVAEALLRRLSLAGANRVRALVARISMRALDLAFEQDEPLVRERLGRILPPDSRAMKRVALSPGRWAGWIAALVVSIAFGTFAVYKSGGSATDDMVEPDTLPAQARPVERPLPKEDTPDAQEPSRQASARSCAEAQLEASEDGRYLLVRDADKAPGIESLAVLDLSLLRSGAKTVIWHMPRSEAEKIEGTQPSELEKIRKTWGLGSKCMESMPDSPDYRVTLEKADGGCSAVFWHGDKKLHSEAVRGLADAAALCDKKLDAAWRWYYSSTYQAYLVQLVVDAYTADYSELVSLRNAFAFEGK